MPVWDAFRRLPVHKKRVVIFSAIRKPTVPGDSRAFDDLGNRHSNLIPITAAAQAGNSSSCTSARCEATGSVHTAPTGRASKIYGSPALKCCPEYRDSKSTEEQANPTGSIGMALRVTVTGTWDFFKVI